MMEPIRVLYVNGGIMDRGGISAYMMNYYRHIDKTKIQIDFIVHGFEKGVFDDEIHAMGGTIYNVPIKSKDYFGNIKALRTIFNTGKYKIVHSHMDAMSLIVLREAKKCGILIRIAHSHNTEHLTNNKLKYFLNEIARKNIYRYATHMCACSELAGKWLFGEAMIKSGKVKIIKNAIELEKYRFDTETRNKLRRELDLEDKFVVGHVGRFDYQKNHMFLLEIFSELVKQKPNAKLVLVGDGHLRNKIEAKIQAAGLSDRVLLLGQRSDVSELLNVFDVFVLPSLFEGLPVVAIEAQANGLKCCLSNKITREASVTDKIKFLDIEGIKQWVEELSKKNDSNRTICEQKFIELGYEINGAAEKLCKMYTDLLKESYN